MNKALALDLIGGTPLLASKAIGISRSAIAQWPETLPPKLSDRVLAAWARENVQDLPPLFRSSCSAEHSSEVAHG